MEPFPAARDGGRRGPSRLRGWLAREKVPALAVGGVLLVMLAGVLFVNARIREKNALGRAAVALAKVPGALNQVPFVPPPPSPSSKSFPGTPPTAAELSSRAFRPGVQPILEEVRRDWPNPTARRLLGEGKAIDARASELTALLLKGRDPRTGLLPLRRLESLKQGMQAQIAAAQAQLARAAQNQESIVGAITFVTVGLASVLLVGLAIGIAGARRRRVHLDIERRVMLDSQARLKALVEHSSDMISVVRPDTTVIYQAGAVRSLLGHEPQEVEGSMLTRWVDPADRASLVELCSTEGGESRELRLRHRDGSERTCEVHATSLLHDPVWEGIVLNVWDLSDRRALEQRLRHQAFHDPLTGLPNRVLAIDRAQQMLAQARRNALPVAALYVALDGFKHVNESFGHAAGDKLLQCVAERLCTLVRDGDTAARLSGDEFVVLIQGSTLLAGPELVAERLLEVLSQPFDLGEEVGRRFSLTASIGIAMGDSTAESLLQNADVALHEAKRAGRNRYVLFEKSMHAVAQERLTLEMDLGEALKNDELFLLYQPTVDLQTERIFGLEALLRWRHPVRGIIDPGTFIPVAERSELIVSIGRWVLQEASRQAVKWRESGHRLRMSVNVSARQLDSDVLIEDVRHALHDSGLYPADLTIEVTETMLMRDADATAERLAALKRLGVLIAIDDFGTGYSSLAYLRRFPVDILKIDRSFISGITSSDGSTSLIHTLVQLGKALEIETLAEGIEEPAQLRALQHERCDHGQGYLFARPLPPDAVEQFLGPGPAVGRVAEPVAEKVASRVASRVA